MAGVSRRRFLEDSLFAAAAMAAASCAGGSARVPSWLRNKPAAASDRLRVAVVGVNGRGMAHVKAFAGRRDTEIVAICDVDEHASAKARRAVSWRTGRSPVHHRDLRRLLEDRSIDAISIAMPNHWHALATAWAVQAGKDVYLEKPVSHNLAEGRLLVDLARKHGRIVQTGSQSRSNPGMRRFIDHVRSGRLGKVTLARGLCYKRRDSIGKHRAPVRPDSDLDYDLWLGPAAARRDVPRSKLHYDWHWQWDYGNGDIGNQGVHEMDKARWGLGKTALPSRVVSLGGRYGYADDGQTPNTQVAVFDYGDCQLVFEVRGLPSDGLRGAKIGNIFHGSEGYAVSTNYTSGTIFDRRGKQVAHYDGEGNHFGNFIDAVRSRNHGDLTADIEDGHQSAALCHLANISYRLGTAQPWGSLPAGSDALAEAVERAGRHLADNRVSLGRTSVRLGRELTVDPAGETLSGSDAQALLSRPYRKGFQMPEGTIG
jgi:predicted dehydrogenase